MYQTDENGTALGGLDPVACHRGESAMGSRTFSHEWGGATWLFARRENLDRFVADPQRYAPQAGGYCALAAQFGKRAHANPRVQLVHGGKLYLFASPVVRGFWRLFGSARKLERAWSRLEMEADT